MQKTGLLALHSGSCHPKIMPPDRQEERLHIHHSWPQTHHPLEAILQTCQANPATGIAPIDDSTLDSHPLPSLQGWNIFARDPTSRTAYQGRPHIEHKILDDTALYTLIIAMEPSFTLLEALFGLTNPHQRVLLP